MNDTTNRRRAVIMRLTESNRRNEAMNYKGGYRGDNPATWDEPMGGYNVDPFPLDDIDMKRERVDADGPGPEPALTQEAPALELMRTDILDMIDAGEWDGKDSRLITLGKVKAITLNGWLRALRSASLRLEALRRSELNAQSREMARNYEWQAKQAEFRDPTPPQFIVTNDSVDDATYNTYAAHMAVALGVGIIAGFFMHYISGWPT